MNAEKFLQKQQVAGTRDRKELRQSLHQTEQQALRSELIARDLFRERCDAIGSSAAGPERPWRPGPRDAARADSRERSMIRYVAGTMKKVSAVEKNIPPTTAIPSGARGSRPRRRSRARSGRMPDHRRQGGHQDRTEARTGRLLNGIRVVHRKAPPT